MLEGDTIAAIATPPGEGGIAIIRVSGPDAISMVDTLYKGAKSLVEVNSHTIHYGHIVAPSNNEVLDEVMVTVMHRPRTYTREDVVEINCHGGITSVRRILQEVLRSGARLAEPGEFTKRAFLNGRIDLSQAEAVIDLIRAKTERAARQSMYQMQGKLSQLIKPLRQQILELLASIEVSIDYPEYDAEDITFQTVVSEGEEILSRIDRLLMTAKQGKILREGIYTVIVGRPNVGKSSLLNTLVQENRAIVTDIPGTTRDVIEEYINVRGIPLRLVDTAGIRVTEDVVERIGVERSERALEDADLLLIVLNNGEQLTAEDERLLMHARDRQAIIIVNKIDLPTRLDFDRVRQLAGEKPLVSTSLLRDEGIDLLEQSIVDLFFKGEMSDEDVFVGNVRHVHLLEQAKVSIQEAIAGAKATIPIDMIQMDLHETWRLLGAIIGESVSDDLIDQLFSQFCLGK